MLEVSGCGWLASCVAISISIPRYKTIEVELITKMKSKMYDQREEIDL